MILWFLTCIKFCATYVCPGARYVGQVFSIEIVTRLFGPVDSLCWVLVVAVPVWPLLRLGRWLQSSFLVSGITEKWSSA